MKIWTCGSSPWSGSRNAWMRIKNVNGASRVNKFWNFFRCDPNDFLPRLVTKDETWLYITMSRRQSNSQWSGGIVAHRAPKKFRVQKSAGKVLASIFWDQDGILLIDYTGKQISNFFFVSVINMLLIYLFASMKLEKGHKKNYLVLVLKLCDTMIFYEISWNIIGIGGLNKKT